MAAINKWDVCLVAENIIQIIDVITHIKFDDQAVRIIREQRLGRAIETLI